MSAPAVNISVLADAETHAFIAKMMEIMELMEKSGNLSEEDYISVRPSDVIEAIETTTKEKDEAKQ
jgi:hypothetical protein